MLGRGGKDESLMAFNSQLKGCRGKLMRWSKQKFGRWKEALSGKQDRLETLYGSVAIGHYMEEIRRLEKEIEVLLYWEVLTVKTRQHREW